MNIQLTARDCELLRYEYDEALKAELKTIFFKFENAPEDKFVELDMGYLKYLLEMVESSSHLSMSITI